MIRAASATGASGWTVIAGLDMSSSASTPPAFDASSS